MSTLSDAIDGLRDAATLINCAASYYPEGCAPIIPGVTHCAACGFHRSVELRIIQGGSRGPLCTTPEWHVSA